MIRITVVFLALLLFAQTSHAIGPRLIYVEPASSLNDTSESLLGRYLYTGVIFADNNPAGFAGFSMKFGWGQTGKKYNISYMAGNKALSLEGGVSYITQDADAGLLINSERKGYAFEASLRLNAFSVIGVFAKENISFELGLGF